MADAVQSQKIDATNATRDAPHAHRIVIVGGGAGGLELATRLGDKLGRRGKADITLIDKARAHLWKPLLHEIAAGSMDLGHHELDYLAQAHWHHFRYRTGEMIGLDRARREVLVGPVVEENGTEVTPARGYPYDTLVLAIDSLTNDFGTPGVADHTICLETPEQAARFHTRLVNACVRAQNQNEPLHPGQLQVAIIGAGATGVDRIDPDRDITLHLIEAADRILPALPPRIATAATELLGGLGVKIYTSARVAAVVQNGVRLADGRVIDAELVVWAAGVKAPAFLQNLDGLETNASNQLVVRQTLQTTRDDNIFAIGDCAACPWPERNTVVPPRAQAAHQQSTHLAGQLPRKLAGQAPTPWRYRDFGSLVSLGEYSTVGSLMGKLVGRSLLIEGYFARLMYVSLYKMHEYALHGFIKVALETVVRLINRRTEPQVKLH